MKWRRPKDGERRELTCFAWFPVRTDDGWTVWLEHYARTDEYLATNRREGVWVTMQRMSYP